jgi:ubiquinone/menaquinone biosynthesis C-methylase UbiE
MFNHPHKNITESFVALGMKVADFGAGVGHHTLLLAERVGEAGEVYAIDVQKDLLSRLHKEATEKGFANVHQILGDIEISGGSRLANASVDRVLMVNVLFQLEKKTEALQEARRILKRDGKLSIIDWTGSFNNMGPHPDHVITKENARKLAEEVGFEYEKDTEAGEHHYGMIFKIQ